MIAVVIIGAIVGSVLLFVAASHFLHADEAEASGCPWPFHCDERDGYRD